MASYEFTPAFGNRPSQLVGRGDMLDTILNGLDTRPGSKDRAIIMLGQRGYGKTVMLWEIAERARERGFVVMNPVSVRDGLMRRIVEKLREAGSSVLGQGQTRITGGGIGALGFSASLDFSHENTEVSSEQRLTELCRELTKRNVGTLILVDELQASNPEIRSLVGTYQELVGEQLDVAMVLAGLPASVSSTLNDRVLTFLNRARKLTLAPLATGDVDAFFRRAFRASGVEIDTTLRREAAQHSEGSPYLMQLIGHYIVSYANDGLVDRQALEDAFASADDEYGNDICATTLAGLSGKDCEYLLTMARLGGTCRTSEVAHNMGVAADYAQQYRKRLLDAGIIEAPYRGTVRLAIPYLGDYLLQEYDL